MIKAEGSGLSPQAERLPFRDLSLTLEERVADLISRLTLEEKISLMTSRQEALARLGIPEFTIGGEAAHGLVVEDGKATVFPQTIGLACSWDEELLQRLGQEVGREARIYYQMRMGCGGLCLWAPTVDMERDPRWGRTEEAYGEDPLLTARLAGAYIRGLQGAHPFYLQMVATLKHFYANNNEEDRSSFSASINFNLKRDYYLKPYSYLLKEARAASLMTAYNAINGIPAMVHPDLRQILRGEWGWDGFVVSDDTAFSMLVERHQFFKDYADAVACAIKAGVDNITDEKTKVAKALRQALHRGLLTEADLDQALGRVFRYRFRLGQFDPPERIPFTREGGEALQLPGQHALAYEAALKSIVLLRNEPVNGQRLLPLPKARLKKLAVIGPLADGVYRDWYGGKPGYAITPLQALSQRLGAERILFFDGSDIVRLRTQRGQGIATYTAAKPYLVADRPEGELFKLTEWAEGVYSLQSLFNLQYLTVDDKGFLKTQAKEIWGWHVREAFYFEYIEDQRLFKLKSWDGHYFGLDEQGFLKAIQKPADIQDTEFLPASTKPILFCLEVLRDKTQTAAELASQSEYCLVFVGSHPLVGAKEEIDRHKLELNSGQRQLLASVLAINSKTIGIITSGYPLALAGLEDSLKAILYMASGGQEEGNALADVLLGVYSPAGRLPLTWYAKTDDLGSIFNYDIRQPGTTYRFFKGKPWFAFGHGLSYADIRYVSLRLVQSSLKEGQVLKLLVGLKNKSPFPAEEVVQVYGQWLEALPGQPLQELLAFKRVSLKARQKVSVELSFAAEQLKCWDPQRECLVFRRGKLQLRVGPASDRLKLKTDIWCEGELIDYRPWEWFPAPAYREGENLLIREDLQGKSWVYPASPGQMVWLSPGPGDFGDGGEFDFEARILAKEGGLLALKLADGLDLAQSNLLPMGEWQSLRLGCLLPSGRQKILIGLRGSLWLERFIFCKKIIV